MGPHGQCHIHKRPPIIHILSRIIKFLAMTPISLRLILTVSSHLRLGLYKSLFLVFLLVKMLKVLISYSILAICSAHFNFIFNKDGVRTSVHNYHYAKNSVRQFPQSSVQNFMRDRSLFLHSSTWYLAHGVSHSSHTQSGPGS